MLGRLSVVILVLEAVPAEHEVRNEANDDQGQNHPPHGVALSSCLARGEEPSIRGRKQGQDCFLDGLLGGVQLKWGD